MAYTDLTAHHSIAPYGGFPPIVETGGPYGGRYIAFNGASALQISNMASFAVDSTGDFCIETCVRSKLQAIISITAGVADFTLAAPGANVVPLVDASHLQIATQGTVGWSV